MFLKNNAKRLITINTEMKTQKDENGGVISAENGKTYILMPAGKSVEVPDAIVRESKFVKALIKTGDILEVAESTFDESDFDDMSKAELLEYAESEGLDVSASMKKADILACIEEAQ